MCLFVSAGCNEFNLEIEMLMKGIKPMSSIFFLSWICVVGGVVPPLIGSLAGEPVEITGGFSLLVIGIFGILVYEVLLAMQARLRRLEARADVTES